MDELISIIVPVYNTEEYIEECIKSVLNQSYVHWEMILVDDGSSDKSGEICDAYSRTDIRIKVFHQDNGGQSKARNLALENCSGLYYMFLDSDDRLAEHAIENLYCTMKEHNADMCYGGIRLFGMVKCREIYVCDRNCTHDPMETCRKMFLHEGLDSNTTAKIYKADLWKNIRFPEGKIFEDVPIMYKIILNCNKTAQCCNCVYEQRSREGSTTRSEFNGKKEIYTRYSEDVYLDIKNNYPELKEAAYVYYLFSVVDNFIHLSCSKNRKEFKSYHKALRQIIIKNFKWIMTENILKERELRVICCLLGLGELASDIRKKLRIYRMI